MPRRQHQGHWHRQPQQGQGARPGGLHLRTSHQRAAAQHRGPPHHGSSVFLDSWTCFSSCGSRGTRNWNDSLHRYSPFYMSAATRHLSDALPPRRRVLPAILPPLARYWPATLPMRPSVPRYCSDSAPSPSRYKMAYFSQFYPIPLLPRCPPPDPRYFPAVLSLVLRYSPAEKTTGKFFLPPPPWNSRREWTDNPDFFNFHPLFTR